MTRDEYLKKIWLPYPAFDQMAYPDWVCGRFLSQTDNEIEFYNGSGTERVVVSVKTEEKPAEVSLGRPIPAELLVRGDAVALSPEGRCYLLAPCLSAESWQPQVEKVKDWDRFLQKTHQFFRDRSYQEVLTPFLVPSPGVDHHIDFMGVRGTRTQREWCLPTSPEISLKKALCQGHESIYEIKPCFRDDLPGPWHQAEFTMLEWYRSYISLENLQGETVELLFHLIGRTVPVRSTSIQALFREHLHVNLTPTTTREELLSWAEQQAVDWAQDDDWNDLFFRLYMEKIEPALSGDQLWIVSDFPPQQASLSRINSQGWSERFEVYWRGVELANAYHELNDPEANIIRFQHEEHLRGLRHAALSTHDTEFFQLLAQGLPPACGIALGLSRLYWLLRGAKVRIP